MSVSASARRGSRFRVPWRRLRDFASAYAITYVFGWIAIPVTLLLFATGRIRTRGYWRARREMRKGKLIIAANHPELVSSFVIGFLFCPLYPIWADKLWSWSVPDRKTFLPRSLWWMYPLARCIQVDRAMRGGNGASFLRMRGVLEAGQSLVIHPEGGRTNKGTVLYSGKGGRMIRRIEGKHAVGLAVQVGARIMPVWIDAIGVRDGKLLTSGEALISFFRYGMTIHFGTPYVESSTDAAAIRRLEDAILNV